MDQKEPADQSLLRHQPERREDLSLDRDQHLRVGGHPQPRTEDRSPLVRLFTYTQPHPVQENPVFQAISSEKTTNP